MYQDAATGEVGDFADLATPFRVHLGAASIDSNGTFRNRDVSVSLAGVPLSGSGAWGGQFSNIPDGNWRLHAIRRSGSSGAAQARQVQVRRVALTATVVSIAGAQQVGSFVGAGIFDVSARPQVSAWLRERQPSPGDPARDPRFRSEHATEAHKQRSVVPAVYVSRVARGDSGQVRPAARPGTGVGHFKIELTAGGLQV